MDAQSGAGPHGSAPPAGRVHILGAGPVGLLLTALLQPLDWAAVRLYEKRHDYTRTHMVRLASYLVADSVEAYRADHFDEDNVEAVFDPSELAAALAVRQSIPPPSRSCCADGRAGSSSSTRSSAPSAISSTRAPRRPWSASRRR